MHVYIQYFTKNSVAAVLLTLIFNYFYSLQSNQVLLLTCATYWTGPGIKSSRQKRNWMAYVCFNLYLFLPKICDLHSVDYINKERI